MVTFLIFSFIALIVSILINISNLISVLIILEFVSFLTLILAIVCTLGTISCYNLSISLFCFIVVESVLGLIGLVLLVSFSGSDYLTCSLITN